MKVKVSEYIADFLAGKGISHVFTVTGGGAMHLNDALGHHPGLHCVYSHHEQAAAVAAEAYARIDGRIAALCVTTGPGGTNAITGVLGGWLDSVPMLVVSGQVRYDTTVRSSGLPLRQLGDQEFYITEAVGCMTKYCEMLVEPKRIGYCLEKAYYLATHGRPGPCWLDIPLDVQSAVIDTDGLESFDVSECAGILPPKVGVAAAERVLEKIRGAERPVIYAGNGIRLGGAYVLFRRVAEKLGVPVVGSLNSFDQMPNGNPLYAGRAGTVGDRAGNFAVQNSDLLLNLANRLDVRQVGYNWDTFARAAYRIMVDIDPLEMRKPTLKIDMPIHADIKDFLEKLDGAIDGGTPVFRNTAWPGQCRAWAEKYPAVTARQREAREPANVYNFIEQLSLRIKPGAKIVLGNGSASVVAMQAFSVGEGQRVIVNSSVAAMGYGFPAAVGISYAAAGEDVICIDGDGSFQMNIQELQTVVHNKLPVKIFIIANNGYHSIRQSQTNLFGGRPLVGVGGDSGDLSFPDLSKLAPAYGIPYFSIRGNSEMDTLDAVLSTPGYALCEVSVTTEQNFEPKSAAQKRPDGSLYSAPLEDLAPFLPRGELEGNMYIPLCE